MSEKLLKDGEGDVFRVTWPGEDVTEVPSSVVQVTPSGDVPVEGRDWERV